jgi:hypothetical protein
MSPLWLQNTVIIRSSLAAMFDNTQQLSLLITCFRQPKHCNNKGRMLIYNRCSMTVSQFTTTLPMILRAGKIALLSAKPVSFATSLYNIFDSNTSYKLWLSPTQW